MPITDVLPALDHARLAHQPTNAILAQPKDTLLTQLVSALLNAVMVSSLAVRPAILEINCHQDARIARFNLDIPALVNLQSADLLDLLLQSVVMELSTALKLVILEMGLLLDAQIARLFLTMSVQDNLQSVNLKTNLLLHQERLSTSQEKPM